VLSVSVCVGVELILDIKSGSDPTSCKDGQEALNLLASLKIMKQIIITIIQVMKTAKLKQ
jgi:hypothetical protein